MLLCESIDSVTFLILSTRNRILSNNFCGVCTESFHTLALDNVPVFGSHNRVSAYRFVTLVDVSAAFVYSFATHYTHTPPPSCNS